MQKICLTDGNIILYATINDTVAAKDFLDRLPCNFSGCDSGIDYCCTAAKGRYDPTETQIGWKNGDLCLCDGWFAILYGGEEMSERFGNVMVIGELEEQSLVDVRDLPQRVTLHVTTI